MKTIKNRCGKKTSGCAVEYELPYGIAPKHVSDVKPNPQGEAGLKKPKTKSK